MDFTELNRQLSYAVNGINSAYGALAQSFGLSYNSLMLLTVLDEGECTQKEVCSILQLPKSTVHSILLEYMKKGYMTLASGTNKKEKLIRLTPSGEEYMQKVMSALHAIENKAMEKLGDELSMELVRVNSEYNRFFNEEVTDFVEKAVF